MKNDIYELKTTISHKVYSYLEKYGFSFGEFAEQLGIAKSTCWRLVNDKCANLQLSSLIKIANCLDITVDELLRKEG